MSDEEYNLTLEEAAQILGFVKDTVRRYTREGKLSKIYVNEGGKRLIKVKEEEVRKLAEDMKKRAEAKELPPSEREQKGEMDRGIKEFLIKRYDRAIYKIGQLEERLGKLEEERRKLARIRTFAWQWLSKKAHLEVEKGTLEDTLKTEREKMELGEEENKIISDDLALERERRAKLEAENQRLDLELKKERNDKEKLEGDLKILKEQVESTDIKFTKFIKAKLGRILKRKRSDI